MKQPTMKDLLFPDFFENLTKEEIEKIKKMMQKKRLELIKKGIHPKQEHFYGT